jgi:hypothetical protein
LSIKENCKCPFVLFLHGVIEIYSVLFKVIDFCLIALLLAGANEQKVKRKQTQNERNETIMEKDFPHEDVDEHGIDQDQS